MPLLDPYGYHAMLVIVVAPRHQSWVGLMVAALLCKAYMVPSGTTNVSPQGGGIQVSASSGALSPVLKVHGVFSNRD